MPSRVGLTNSFSGAGGKNAIRFGSIVIVLGVLVGATACESAAAPVAKQAPKRPVVDQASAQLVYKGGLKNGWKDYGWAKRELGNGKPARLNLSNYAGWILAKPGLLTSSQALPGGLVFRVRSELKPSAATNSSAAKPTQVHAGPLAGFLDVRLMDAQKHPFPHVRVQKRHEREEENGWVEVAIGAEELNPNGQRFDRLQLRAVKALASDWVEIDDVAFFGKAPPNQAHVAKPALTARFQVDCSEPTTKISSRIYGIAFNARRDKAQQWLWKLRPSGRRWGGNAMSRYNWRLGNAWNTANDWFFTNTNYTGDPKYSWTFFYDDNAAHQVGTAITIPLLGWVAKDTSSYSFSVKRFGSQQKVDPAHPDRGNGVSKGGKTLASPAPSATSVKAEAPFMGPWIDAIAAHRAAMPKPVRALPHTYLLGNEPMLWNSTHRDVHPKAVGYDELLSKTIAVAKEIRRRDPNAIIAGPGLWGWPAYSYSAQDKEAGFMLKPDRRAHDDEPLLAWYLRKLHAHEEKTGERLLDLVDVHFYPQGGVYGESDDEKEAALRLRSTRALWDPTYEDESWIKAPVHLIGRMQSLIAHNYPGRGLLIGEYNFGAEQHMSGGLAQAEALGRFGRHGVQAAYDWTYPKLDSPAFDAFLAYRNFDGQGGHFLSQAVSVAAPPRTSLFASTDGGNEMVLVLLNFSPHTPLRAELALVGCPTPRRAQLFSRTEKAAGLLQGQAPQFGMAGPNDLVTMDIPPYSINVVALNSPQATPLPAPKRHP